MGWLPRLITCAALGFSLNLASGQTPPTPGPFGLRMGMSRADLGIAAVAKDGLYSVTKVPAPNEWYEHFTLLMSPAHGLCKFTAFHKALDRMGPEGSMLWVMMHRLHFDFSRKLGPPSRTEGPDFSQERILDRGFVDDLVVKKRRAAIHWDNVVGGATQVTHIGVEGLAKDAKQVYTTMTVEFANAPQCMAELADLATPKTAAAAPSATEIRQHREVLLRCHALAGILSFGQQPEEQQARQWRELSKDFLLTARSHSDALGEAPFSNPSGSDARVTPHFAAYRSLHLSGSNLPAQEAVTCSKWKAWVPAGLWLQVQGARRQQGLVVNFGSDSAAAQRFDLNEWWKLGVKASDVGPASNQSAGVLGARVRDAFGAWARKGYPAAGID